MIIVMKKGQEEVSKTLINRFKNSNNIFKHKNRIAILGISENDLNQKEKHSIENIIENVPKAVQSSRLLHPENTIIKTKHSIIGNKTFTMMAGPCSIESKDLIMRMAKVAKKGGATILRGGAFKPRTSPYSFQGLGLEGLKYLREAADKFHMDAVTEVMDTEHVKMVSQYADILQIGARNMQNFSLLKEVGKSNLPVMLKRGLSATIDDVLNASEYISSQGNHKIILVERGIRTFDNKYTRNTLDVGAIAVLKKLSHYPVVVDPSHAAGHTDIVLKEALAGSAMECDGMIVEIHDHPKDALSDGPQALLPNQYLKMANKAFKINKFIREA